MVSSLEMIDTTLLITALILSRHKMPTFLVMAMLAMLAGLLFLIFQLNSYFLVLLVTHQFSKTHNNLSED